MIFYCPGVLTEDEVIPFVNALYQYRDDPSLSTDFSTLTFGKPYGTLLLAQGIKALVEYRNDRGLVTQVSNPQVIREVATPAISYLCHIGFFRYVGLPFGNAPNEAPGSSTYVPITQITRAELLADLPGKVIQESVVRRSERIAALIFATKNRSRCSHIVFEKSSATCSSMPTQTLAP